MWAVTAAVARAHFYIGGRTRAQDIASDLRGLIDPVLSARHTGACALTRVEQRRRPGEAELPCRHCASRATVTHVPL